MTVDEILASGTYTDRRGRMWAIAMADGRWGATDGRYPIGGKPFSVDRMRLLIERDIHRDECAGLDCCHRHPVPSVLVDPDDPGKFLVCEPNKFLIRWFIDSLPEAMDAAYGLAVEGD